MSLAILFHFLGAQHVTDVNISIIRSLRLFCWITTLVVLFLVQCVLEFRCGWVGVVSVLQAEAWSTWTNLMSLAILFHFLCAQHVSDINISIIRSLQLFCWITTLVVLFLVRCVLEFRCGWVGVVSVLQASACNTDITPTQPHRNSNTHRTKNNRTNVVIQQNSRKLLTMDILISETCWAHKKWNKIASDIKLLFHSSTIKFHNNTSSRSPVFPCGQTDRHDETNSLFSQFDERT